MVYKQFFLGSVFCVLVAACETPGGDMQMAQSQDDLDNAPANLAEQITAGEIPYDDEGNIDRNRVICKREIVTGSRFSKRYCAPWWRWQQIRGQSRLTAEEIQRRRITGRDN